MKTYNSVRCDHEECKPHVTNPAGVCLVDNELSEQVSKQMFGDAPDLTCNQCGKGWKSRVANPACCPRCKRYDWNEPKKGLITAVIVESVSYNLGSDKDGNTIAIYEEDEETVKKFYKNWPKS